jgi:hypothetical protein
LSSLPFRINFLLQMIFIFLPYLPISAVLPFCRSAVLGC